MALGSGGPGLASRGMPRPAPMVDWVRALAAAQEDLQGARVWTGRSPGAHGTPGGRRGCARRGARDLLRRRARTPQRCPRR
eukprot:985714-Lingulodinium_polyedra.AAC.1